MVSSLAPFPPALHPPMEISRDGARDPARAAKWKNDLLTALHQHDNALKSYLLNLEGLATRTETDVTTINNNITTINNNITTINSVIGTGLGAPDWEWNGTDTSQFESTAGYTSGTVTPVLAVTASANGNQTATNYLEISSVGNGTAGFAFFINTELPFATERRDMLIEWVTDGTGTTGYGGFSFLADNAGTAHSYNVFIGPTAGWLSQVDNGTATISGSTPSRVWNGNGECRGRLYVHGTKPASGVPRFHSIVESRPGNGGDATYSMRIDRRDDFPNEPPGSTWNTLGCKKFGIAIQASGGNPIGSFRITELRVFLI